MLRATALAILALAVATWWAASAGPRPSVVALSNDTDVTFAVTQDPAAPRVLQSGTTVTFSVEATANTGLSSLFFEFDYPAGLMFLDGVSDPPGVPCYDDTPSSGVVRCDYGAVVPGALVPLELTFRVDGDATTAPDQFRVRAGVSDGQPDTAADGDETASGLGALGVFDAADFTVSVSVDRTSTFERADVVYTATLTNEAGNVTAPFSVELALANGTAAQVTCSAGSAAGATTAVARCLDVDLAAGATLTMTVRVTAADTASGEDLAAELTAPAVGIGPPDVEEPTVTVREAGLLRVSGEPETGQPLTVCTADVDEDVLGERAAGAAQPNDVDLVRGTLSGSPVLQLADFEVSGPAVEALAAANGCGENQSGVTFVPQEAGTYTVTARYNFGGTNVLELTVGGEPTPTPTPTTPAPSPEVQPVRPAPGAVVPRSRLAFVVDTGALAVATVRFVIVRTEDGWYWDAEAGAWTEARVENPATETEEGWELAVSGTARRLFNDVDVSIEVIAEGDDGAYTSAAPWEVHVR